MPVAPPQVKAAFGRLFRLRHQVKGSGLNTVVMGSGHGVGSCLLPPAQRLSTLASHEHGALPRPAALAEGLISLCEGVIGSGLAFCPPAQRLSALASQEHGALPRPAALAEGLMSPCAPRRPLKPLGRSTILSADVVMPLGCLRANLPRCTRPTATRDDPLNCYHFDCEQQAPKDLGSRVA